MATGILRDSIQNIRTLKTAHTGAVEVGDVIVQNGHVLIAVNKAVADADNVYAYRGKAELPKEASLAIGIGDKCYWVASAGNVNKTSSGNTLIGICVEAAAEADTTVLVMLDENR